MSSPQLDSSVREPIDELITDDGEPGEDAVAIIAYTVERALGEAQGGLSLGEYLALGRVADVLNQLDGVAIEVRHWDRVVN